MSDRTLLVWLCVPLFALGCARQKPADEIGTGTRSGSTFSHEHFNFKITFPEDWYIMTEEEQAALMRTGQEMSAGENAQLKAAIKAAESQTLNLVAAFQHPPGAVVTSNMNIIISAERVAHAPGIKTGADYLNHTRNMLMQTPFQPRIDAVEQDQKVGPLTMDVLPVHINMGMQEVHQRMHAARTGDYVLLIAITYTSDEERARLEEILQSMTTAR